MGRFGKPWKMADLTERQRALLAGAGVVDPVTKPATAGVVSTRAINGPNKTEASYRRECIDTRTAIKAVHYEGLTLRMENGHRYTPDWLVLTNTGEIELHEVKGGYRLHSYHRARLAFDQARVEFPCFKFVWATKSDSGWAVGKL